MVLGKRHSCPLIFDGLPTRARCLRYFGPLTSFQEVLAAANFMVGLLLRGVYQYRWSYGYMTTSAHDPRLGRMFPPCSAGPFTPASSLPLTGRSFPATPSRIRHRCVRGKRKKSWLRELRPPRADKLDPVRQSSALRLWAYLRALPPFPFRCLHYKGGEPLGCSCYPPTFARRRSACMYHPLQSTVEAKCQHQRRNHP